MTEQEQWHQIQADGKIIYSGDSWLQAFKEAALRPEFGEIVSIHNGKPGARWCTKWIDKEVSMMIRGIHPLQHMLERNGSQYNVEREER